MKPGFIRRLIGLLLLAGLVLLSGCVPAPEPSSDNSGPRTSRSRSLKAKKPDTEIRMDGEIESIAVPPLPRPATYSLREVMDWYGETSRRRLKPYFDAIGLEYPGTRLTFLALKEEKEMEVWVGSGNEMTYLRTYDVKRASGEAGPKLREGDRQVPEGIYKVLSLNPNSSYHLSMELNYPNEWDKLHARREGRRRPGSDIYIHGRALSIGCLAMGDPAIEELFVLAADVGIENIDVVIAPYDPRERPLEPEDGMPEWTANLYKDIAFKFRRYHR